MAVPIGPRPLGTHAAFDTAYRRRCGERLARWRRYRAMSTYELAKVAGIPNASLITRYEVDGVLPSTTRKFAIAAALRVPADVLWGFGVTEDDDFVLGAANYEEFISIGAHLSHYLSTYCIHDRHGDCRLTCKTCNAPCQCVCHRPDDEAA